MLIATKYEEIYAPEVKDFVYISDNAYSCDDILKMEYEVLKGLDFNVTTPSSLRFTEYFCKFCKADSYVRCLSYYLIELSLVEYKLLKYKPSLLASASVYLSNKILKRQAFKPEDHSQWGGTALEE